MYRNLEYERFLQIQAEDHGTLKDSIILDAIDRVLYVQHLIEIDEQIRLEKQFYGKTRIKQNEEE